MRHVLRRNTVRRNRVSSTPELYGVRDRCGVTNVRYDRSVCITHFPYTECSAELDGEKTLEIQNRFVGIQMFFDEGLVHFFFL